MSKYQAKINILSELLSFPTVRGKDWASVYGDNKVLTAYEKPNKIKRNRLKSLAF